MLLAERKRQRLRARKERTTLVDRVAGLGVGDEPLLGARVDEHLGEAEDRLLRAEGRDDLAVRVERDAEPTQAPRGDGAAQLRQALRERVARALAEALDESAADPLVGGLVRIALAEVDHRHAARLQPPPRLLEAHERVRGHLGQRRRDSHDETVSEP